MYNYQLKNQKNRFSKFISGSRTDTTTTKTNTETLSCFHAKDKKLKHNIFKCNRFDLNNVHNKTLLLGMQNQQTFLIATTCIKQQQKRNSDYNI